MNKKKTIHLSGALVAALAVALICLWPRDRPVAQPHESNSTTAENDAKQAPSWPGRPPPPRSLKKPGDVSEEDWKAFLRNRAIAEASNQRVLFYGKVVDQNGDPVSGAVIQATSTARTGVAEALASGKGQKHKDLKAATDTKGKFKLDGGTGFGLHIRTIRKDGYVLSPQTESQFMYGQILRDPSSSRFHHPDPSNPVVFRMWKLGKLEPLIFRRTGALRDYVDKSREGGVYMNFIKKDRHNDPEAPWDCHLDVTRADDSPDKQWHIRLRIQDGGWIAATEDDPFRFEAPEDGYVQELHFQGTSLKGQIATWNGYVKLKGGSAYGAVRMDIYAYHTNDFAVYFNELRINPNGSRNLQYDGTNKIRPGFR